MRDDEFFRMLAALDAELSRGQPPPAVLDADALLEREAAALETKNVAFLAWVADAAPAIQPHTVH